MELKTNSNFIMINDEIHRKDDIDDLYIEDDISIYEVIRIIDGIPLFYEDHMQRMYNSCKRLNCDFPYDKNTILDYINNLIYKNQINNMNVKIVYSGFENSQQQLVIFFIQSFYPDLDMYNNGVKVITVNANRDNPNIKSVNEKFKTNIKEELNKRNAFEAILISEEGTITEGSRSNIFFVKENKLITAPKGDVLLGITRKKILEICEKLQIDIIEKKIEVRELADMDGIFMTGTSVGVLPIREVNDYNYKSFENNVIKNIQNEYNKEVIKYIDENK